MIQKEKPLERIVLEGELKVPGYGGHELVNTKLN
jgi:hypothetical protein